MSFNRLMYDDCACKQQTEDSTTPMQYQLYKGKFENCNKCDTEGGVARDTISYGDLVSIENKLRNQKSTCWNYLYTDSGFVVFNSNA